MQRLTLAQQNTLFKEQMGNLLFPHGFFYHRKVFFRLHEHVLLSVAFVRTAGQGFDIALTAMPLTFGFYEKALSERTLSMMRMDFVLGKELASKEVKDIYISSFPNRLEKYIDVFNTYVLPQFVKVHDIETGYAFLNWFGKLYMGGTANDTQYLWGLIYLEQYDEALEIEKRCLCLYEKHIKQIQNAIEMEILDDDLSMETKKKLKASQYDDLNRMQGLYANTEEVVFMIENRNYDRLRKMAIDKIEISKDAMQHFFGDKLLKKYWV